MLNQQITIMLADDHPALTQGLAIMLNEEKRLKVIGIAKNGAELLELVAKQQPDIAIIDIEMPVLNGLCTIEKLTKEYPKVKTIAYSTHNDKVLISELIGLGARGYLPKNICFDEMVKIICKIKNDGYYFDTTVSKLFIDSSFRLKIFQSQIAKIGLTKRELEILELICKEISNSEIANKLSISIDTVDFHRRNIYKKTNASSAIGLVKYAIKYGLLDING